MVALDVTVSVPFRLPFFDGVNDSVTVQLEPGARGAPQVLVCWKSPLTVTLEIEIGSSELGFDTVSVCGGLVVPIAWSGKDKLPEDTESGSAPVPFSCAVLGLLIALETTVSTPARAPVAVGKNVTVTVQAPPGASSAGAIGQSLAAV